MQPLAERLRPKNLEEYIGQYSLMGEDGVVRKSIQAGLVPSMILWGPPGVGKTTLAQIIAQSVDRPFFTLSAINSGVKDVREIISKASERQLFGGGKTPILFIDEIHRFSKSQQDSLLGAVEKGTVTLIGATTENPGFEVISALLSRCQVYRLEHHSAEDLEKLLLRAIQEDEILKKRKIELKEIEVLLQYSSGDARRLLNNFELVVNSVVGDVVLDNALVKQVVSKNPMLFDKQGDQHYDIASALIKSIRGSDADAALYYLARLIEGGEDPKFIVRRLLISASEDIGLANPTAMVMANACFDAVERLGYPEARIPMGQTVIYLANSPKSNSAYLAIDKALDYVRKTGELPVPLHLRNASNSTMKEMGYGAEYLYPHNYPNHFVEQEYFPKGHKPSFYEKGHNQREDQFLKWVQEVKGKK
jgi:putative ATPase